MPADFDARLAAVGTDRTQFRRWLAALTGREMSRDRAYKIATLGRRTSIEMDALLAVIADPSKLEELRK